MLSLSNLFCLLLQDSYIHLLLLFSSRCIIAIFCWFYFPHDFFAPQYVPRSFRLIVHFSGNYAAQLTSFFTYRKILPNLVDNSWLWWIMRGILANQKWRNIFERIIIAFIIDVSREKKDKQIGPCYFHDPSTLEKKTISHCRKWSLVNGNTLNEMKWYNFRFIRGTSTCEKRYNALTSKWYPRSKAPKTVERWR